MYVLVCMDLGVISGFEAAGMVDDEDDADEGRKQQAKQARPPGLFSFTCLVEILFCFLSTRTRTHTHTMLKVGALKNDSTLVVSLCSR